MILEGTEYTLEPLNFNDWEIAEIAGYGLDDLREAEKKGLTWYMKALRYLIHLSLIKKHKDITIAEVGSFLTQKHMRQEGLLDFLSDIPLTGKSKGK